MALKRPKARRAEAQRTSRGVFITLFTHAHGHETKAASQQTHTTPRRPSLPSHAPTHAPRLARAVHSKAHLTSASRRQRREPLADASHADASPSHHPRFPYSGIGAMRRAF